MKFGPDDDDVAENDDWNDGDYTGESGDIDCDHDIAGDDWDGDVDSL